VHKDRIARVSKELERKAFHVAGFIIPATYIALLESGTMTRRQCSILLGTLASIQLAIEIGRKVSTSFARGVIAVMGKTMRPEELNDGKITGTVYFMTGMAYAYEYELDRVACMLARDSLVLVLPVLCVWFVGR
jgi:hypothetical protein